MSYRAVKIRPLPSFMIGFILGAALMASPAVGIALALLFSALLYLMALRGSPPGA